MHALAMGQVAQVGLRRAVKCERKVLEASPLGASRSIKGTVGLAEGRKPRVRIFENLKEDLLTPYPQHLERSLVHSRCSVFVEKRHALLSTMRGLPATRSGHTQLLHLLCDMCDGPWAPCGVFCAAALPGVLMST